jgi:putative acetyltransferase
MAEVRVQRVDSTTPAVAELLAASDAYQQALYPPSSLHLLPADRFAAPNTVLLGGFVGDRLVGCGACVNHGEYGELKRMFVRPESRGQGVGRALLAALEAHAVQAGLTWLRLETGTAQPEAIRLYEQAGYTRRGPFGDYGPDPFSVFMEKPLPNRF